eukprot:TRINITY_DN36359_c0_g1_i8.p1 TRINITY_DN36359_c0_g1~~TRINITY_DN36359_c0_g1_i8.p1  ORF type:complete len:115 (-),score=2.35 TRINITY_DN36359_c0_g1_i8:256-600(-)
MTSREAVCHPARSSLSRSSLHCQWRARKMLQKLSKLPPQERLFVPTLGSLRIAELPEGLVVQPTAQAFHLGRISPLATPDFAAVAHLLPALPGCSLPFRLRRATSVTSRSKKAS